MTFNEYKPLALNKICNWKQGSTKNYYPRRTPPYLQYGERGSFGTSQFNGDALYTRNIDGKSEYEILSTLQEMVMAIIAYKTKGLQGDQIATALAVGFPGQLKN